MPQPQHPNFCPAFYPRYRWLFAMYPSHLPTFGLRLQLLLQSTGLSFRSTAVYHSWSLSPWLCVAPSILSLISHGPKSALSPVLWQQLFVQHRVAYPVSRYSLMGPNLLLLLDLPWSVMILPFLIASVFIHHLFC